MMKNVLFILVVILLNGSCSEDKSIEKKESPPRVYRKTFYEIPPGDRGTYTVLEGYTKGASLFKELCGEEPKNYSEFTESIKIGKCPNGRLFDKSKFSRDSEVQHLIRKFYILDKMKNGKKNSAD